MLCAVLAIPDAVSSDLNKLGDLWAYTETHARDLTIPSAAILPERRGDLCDNTSMISDDVRRRVSL